MTLAVSYVAADDIDRAAPAHSGGGILGVIGFGTGRPAALDSSCAFLEVPLDIVGDLSPAKPRFEVWRASGDCQRVDRDGLTIARAGGWLLGMACVASAARDATSATKDIYDRIFAACAAEGCPNLLRTFHYLPGIAATEHGQPRYHAFNAGRHAAYAAAARVAETAPAASALGVPADRSGAGTDPLLWVYFLAGGTAGIPIENARQTSAYRYPPRYGARSPVFSRAMIADPAGDPVLFVSGTASIVGHESLHAGDVAAQTDEIARNLAALLEQCSALGFRPVHDPDLKIYVRRPQDAAVAAARLAVAGLGNANRWLFLHADICRPDLMVEAEAVAILRTIA